VFAFQQSQGPIELAFTDRHGGVSEGPWESLNLGTSNGDEPERVARNHEIVASGLGLKPDQMVRMSQKHGDVVATVTSRPVEIPVADGLVTTTSDLGLLVRVADCVPVVLADVDTGVIGVAHAGRPGLTAGIVATTVAGLRAAGADSLVAWLGPRVCGSCYEVPADMRDDVAAAVPAAWATTSWGTPAVDVGAGVASQLRDLDVDVVDLMDADDSSRWCTRENSDLFSYRRQGQRSGRLGGLVRIRS
jgi:purine-nucleoside/S-methyl-5'-thioadenosine phosphorylase / adenosine deaminase